MKLTQRQVFFFLAAVAPAGKLILMPSQLAAEAKNDLLYPFLAQLAVGAALVFFVLLLARRERTLYALLADMVCPFFAKAFCVLLSAFLLFAAFVPLIEQKLMVQSLFYDTLPSYAAFAPFFLFSAYLCAKPLASMGRVWDALAPVFLIGLAGILLLSVWSADFGALAPAGAAGAGGIARGTAYIAGWFYDAALLLPLVGKFPYHKGMAWKGALCYLGGGLAVALFLAVYYGVFAEIAVTQLYAFAHISKYFSGITALGRIDYLFIFAVTFVMTFYAAMPVQAAVDTIAEAFRARRVLAPLLSVAFHALLLALMLAFNFTPSAVISTITKKLFWLFPAFTAGLPLSVWTVLGIRSLYQRRKYAR